MSETAATAGARPGAGGQRQAPDWAVLLLLCSAQFMVLLDVSIVNIALPSIRQSLGFDQAGLSWVLNAYTLTYAGFLLLGGRLADVLGRRRTLLSALALFTAASLAGGFAPDRTSLVTARAVQGLAGAVLSPVTLTLLTTTFPEGPRRTRAMGVWSGVAGTGAVAGSVLGGVLTGLLGWRWILFVNGPIGAGALVAALAILAKDASPKSERRPRLDVTGAILVTTGLVTTVYGLVTSDSRPAPCTLAALAAGAALFALFALYEGRLARAPLVPLQLLRTRAIGIANLVMFWLSIAVFASFFFQSLYMQNVLAYSPLMAGLGFVPQSVAMLLGAQAGSRIVLRGGTRPLLVGGALLSATGLAWLSRLTGDGTFWRTLLAPGMLVTLGVGLAMTPLALAATSGVPRKDAGLASGILNSTRQIGACIGLAVLSTAATTRAVTPHAAAPSRALTPGYAFAFGVAAAFALIAAITSLAIPSPSHPGEPNGRHHHQGERP
ncbi:putative MFS-type transporter EfpA [Actinomadura sp. RB99]|nr:putative MFS-type transporter EfpA [Actinomadura sp. RB99]